MTDQTAPIPDFLLRHLAERETARNTATAEAYAALTEREQRLVREAAVMGYVQGTRHPADEKHPKDSWVTALVVQECLAFPDLYPTMNAVRDAARQAVGQPDTETAPGDCTCGSAGPAFVPAGHYRDCPQYAAPAVGQSAAPAEAHPPREGWRIEVWDVDGWMPSGLIQPDHQLAAQALAKRRAHRPNARLRLVRETTTWTVEDETR